MNINDNYTCMHPQKYGKVAVLMGGWSAEREVSLNSGSAVLDALKRQAVDCIGIDLKFSNAFKILSSSDISIAFNMLHGRGGEDGVIQGALELLKIPYTGSNILCSSLSMHKAKTKLLLMAVGIATPEFLLIEQNQLNDFSEVDDIVTSLGLPLVVKPVLEGSSLGLSIVHHKQDIPLAIQQASSFNCDVMLERFVDGIEYTVTILGNEVLPVIRLQTPRKFYDYTAKYEADDTHYLCPCGLDKEQESQLKRLAFSVFKTLGAQGWGRIDLFVDGNNKPWVIELNTVPGMTDHSLVPMAANACGISFDELVLRILDEALTTKLKLKENNNVSPV